MEEFDFIDSKFRYAILAAKRAKQLINGSRKKVEMTAENPLTIALEEIAQGKVDFELLNKDYYEDEFEMMNEEETKDEAEIEEGSETNKEDLPEPSEENIKDKE